MNNKIDMSKIPIPVKKALTRLNNYGYKAYLVGGACRNILLNLEVKDWDICTNAPLDQLSKLFRHVKIVGESFGVALVKIGDTEMQIARFRTDGVYEDSRHPSSVNFVDDVMEDLSRRDFTINSIACDVNGNLIYYPNALNNLNQKIIRAVGNTEERFKEDALRMLRAIRFSRQLNFKISHKTELAIINNHDLINNISKERIQEELNKILLSENPKLGIIQLLYLNLLKDVLLELFYCQDCNQNNYHNYDVFNHILETLNYISNDLILRLTALFHDIGKPETKSQDEQGNIHFYNHEEISAEMTEQIMRRLKYSNDIIDEVTYLVRNHMDLINDQMKTNKGCRKLLNRHGESRLRKLIEFRRADLLGSGTRDENEVEQLIQNYRDKLEEVLKEKPAINFNDLAVNGNDIMEVCELKPCVIVGIIKKELMEMVIENHELNTREKLIDVLKEIKKKNNKIS